MSNKDYTTRFGVLRHRQALGVMCALALGMAVLAACGGPSIDPGSTPTDTANAFIAANEAEDAGQIEGMLTPEMKQAGAMFGSSAAKEIQQNREKYGAPIKGQGRVLKVDENGSTAVAHVAIAHDNKCSGCKLPDFLPDWAPAGSYVDTDKLTMQKNAAGKWVIANWEDSSFYSEQRKATRVALDSIPTPTYIIYSDQEATRVALAGATSTAYALSVDATQAPIPTAMPTTPVTVQLTMKNAYQTGGVAVTISRWSSDAILFQVYDRTDQGQVPFNYDPYYDNRTNDYYTDGDGTSRQWLFYVVSPSKKEIKIIRVLDGKLNREDVSAKYYRDLLAGPGVTPVSLDFTSYMDSDQAVKLAREHGYSTGKLEEMFVQLKSRDLKSDQYKNAEPYWAVITSGGGSFIGFFKQIVLNPKTGDIIQNDF